MIDEYIVIEPINPEHKVFLVKNSFNDTIYVRKELSVFDKDVYDYLISHKIDGIPTIKEMCECNEHLIIFEEYIPGQDLEKLLQNGKTFYQKEIIDIISQLCDILLALNEGAVRLVHRDIKPSNVILKENGKVYLLDFNASKFVNETSEKDTVLLGTVGYAAPEQYGFGSSTIQTDIYSLGKLAEQLSANCLDTSDELRKIIKKCTEIDPKNRFASISTLKNALPTSSNTQNSFLPIGFRTGKTRNKILSIIGHLLIIIFWIGAGIDTNKKVSDWANTIFFMSVSFFHLYLLFNYRNLLHDFGLNRNWNRWQKIIYIILLNIFLLFIEVFVYAMLFSSVFR